MTRKPPKGKSLGELNPELSKEWHPTKNGDLTPYDVSAGTGKKVWWKCNKGDDHEWESAIYSRSYGSNCPICKGLKVVTSNCLTTLNHELAKEWHHTKNGALTAYNVTPKSGKKVWWKCSKGDDHEWESIIYSRSYNQGCPFCSGRRTSISNSIAVLNPKLAKDWHPSKNKKLTPFDVSSYSNKKVWWKCKKGDDHEWISAVSDRSNGNNCPVCAGQKVVRSNSLAVLNPELTKEWHHTKNGALTAYNVTPKSGKKVWWKCNKGDDHEWISTVSNRSNGNRCPVCAGQKIVRSNSLAVLNPKLGKEWHPSKNGKLSPFDVGEYSNNRIWWKCSKGDDHEWKSRVAHRSGGTNCPICTGQKVVNSNSLATLNPELTKEWHPTKNGLITPYDITPKSGRMIWWKCSKGDDHEWKSIIGNRNKGIGCPICVGQKVVHSNCLATLNPKLSKEWHPTKNDSLSPYDVTVGTNKKVWWKCYKGDDHEWISSVSNRSRGRECPYCTLTPQSKQELTITFELMLFFNINPKGFKTRIKGKLMSIDIYIPELNLGIEFDGNYWHKDKRALDKLKTEKLEESGFEIMRIREEPLKAITDIDVISKTPFDAKEITNNILKHIIEVYSLDAKRIQKIKKYLLKEEIQNEKGLDAYIDMILTEKGQKNP